MFTPRRSCRRAHQPLLAPGAGPLRYPARVTHLALLTAYAHADGAGRRALIDAAEAVAHGSDHPGLTIAASRFLQVAR